MHSLASAETAEIVSPAACQAELERIVASRTFFKSARLRALLEHIGRNSIEGRLDELTEQQIGIAVFQRAPGYNSTEDTIVRVTVRHLRDRLDLYYREEGFSAFLQLTIPKGSYVASFQQVASAVPRENVLEAEKAPAGDAVTEPLGWPRSAKVALGLCLLAAVAAPLLVYVLVRPSAQAVPQDAGPESLWSALFTPGRKTILVPGDASLDAYVAWEQKPVTLSNYTNQAYQYEVAVSRPPSGRDVPLSVRSVTPMADLRLVAELVRVPFRMNHPEWNDWIEICYARDMVVASTHDNNLVLIGTETFNPWVGLYKNALDFDVHWDYVQDVYQVVNRAPHQGEQAKYIYDRRTADQPNYTHVALLDNTQGQGRVLLIEGTSMGTTYGALSFLKSRHLWQPVMHAATDEQGRLRNFEVLLSSQFIRGGSSNTHIVSIHVH